MSSRNNNRPGTPLTGKERRAAELAAQDLLSKQIADRMGISTKTVESHLHSAKQKAGVRTIAGLAVWWVTTGQHQPAAEPVKRVPPRRMPARPKAPPYFEAMDDYCASRGIS